MPWKFQNLSAILKTQILRRYRKYLQATPRSGIQFNSPNESHRKKTNYVAYLIL